MRLGYFKSILSTYYSIAERKVINTKLLYGLFMGSLNTQLLEAGKFAGGMDMDDINSYMNLYN